MREEFVILFHKLPITYKHQWITYGQPLNSVTVILKSKELFVHLGWTLSGVNQHIGSLETMDRFISDFETSPFIKTSRALIHLEVERKLQKWKPYMVNSCNNFVHKVTGVNIFGSITPYGFYKKLLKNDNISNYIILSHKKREFS